MLGANPIIISIIELLASFSETLAAVLVCPMSTQRRCAHWLRGQGLSDHEVAQVLGLARVRSVDRLLQRHTALDAQRVVREIQVR
jgi:hypothetical protein